jgi:hypothetical protein
MSTTTMTGAIAALTLSAGLATTANAQTFQRAIGDQNQEWHYSIDTTRDGGYVTAGYRSNPNAREDFHVVKYDAFGFVQWERTYGLEGRDIAYSVQQTDDDGYIVAGESTSFQAGFEIVLLRLDAAGGFVWANSYPGTFDTDPVHARHPGVNLDQSLGGRIFVVGNNAGLPTLLAVRPGGTLISGTVYLGAGGPNDQCQIGFTDVAFDQEEQTVVISGTARYFNPDFAGSAGAFRQDGFLFRTTDFGAPTGPLHLYDWPDDLTNPNMPNVWDTGDGLDILPDRTVVLAGRTDFGVRDGRSGTHIVYTRPDLAPFWGRDYTTFGADGNRVNVETAYAAIEYDRRLDAFIQAGRIDNGNFLNAHMQLTDLGGAPIWANAYSGQLFSRGESVLPEGDCGFAMAGHVRGTDAAGGNSLGDIYLVKTDDFGKSGCLEREVFPEPITDPFCIYKDVVSTQVQETIELPDILRVTDSNNVAFCFADDCETLCNSPCNAADVSAPFCTLNVNDIIDFVNAFNSNDLLADVSPFPGGDGLLNVNDVIEFVNAFNAGCP